MAGRCEAGTKFVVNAVRGMFKRFISSSGRWDFEGIKLELTVLKGRRELTEQEASLVARLGGMQV